jgi:hypothetical protein
MTEKAKKILSDEEELCVSGGNCHDSINYNESCNLEFGSKALIDILKISEGGGHKGGPGLEEWNGNIYSYSF